MTTGMFRLLAQNCRLALETHGFNLAPTFAILWRCQHGLVTGDIHAENIERQLKAEKLISIERHLVTIDDPEGPQMLAQFEPLSPLIRAGSTRRRCRYCPTTLLAVRRPSCYGCAKRAGKRLGVVVLGKLYCDDKHLIFPRVVTENRGHDAMRVEPAADRSHHFRDLEHGDPGCDVAHRRTPCK